MVNKKLPCKNTPNYLFVQEISHRTGPFLGDVGPYVWIDEKHGRERSAQRGHSILSGYSRYVILSNKEFLNTLKLPSVLKRYEMQGNYENVNE